MHSDNEKESYGSLASKIEAVGTDVHEVFEAVKKIGDKVDAHSTRLATMEATFSTLGIQSFQAESHKDRSEMRSELKQHAQTIAYLQADQESMGKDVDRLEAGYADIQRKETGLQWSWGTLLKVAAILGWVFGAVMAFRR